MGTLLVFFVLVSYFALRSLFSPLTTILCVQPAGLSHMADDVPGGNLPCVRVGAHKQIRVSTQGLLMHPTEIQLDRSCKTLQKKLAVTGKENDTSKG